MKLWYNQSWKLEKNGGKNVSIFIKILLFVCSFSIIVLVLIQPDKSHGMSASMGLGASNTIFGISKDGGPLAEATEYICIFIYSCIFTNIFVK